LIFFHTSIAKYETYLLWIHGSGGRNTPQSDKHEQLAMVLCEDVDEGAAMVLCEEVGEGALQTRAASKHE